MSKREKTKQEKRQWVLTVVILSFALSVVMSVLTSLFVDSAGLLVALLAWLQYRLWFGHGGAGDVHALRQKVAQQQRDNGGLQQRNDALAAEVAELKRQLAER